MSQSDLITSANMLLANRPVANVSFSEAMKNKVEFIPHGEDFLDDLYAELAKIFTTTTMQREEYKGIHITFPNKNELRIYHCPNPNNPQILCVLFLTIQENGMFCSFEEAPKFFSFGEIVDEINRLMILNA